MDFYGTSIQVEDRKEKGRKHLRDVENGQSYMILEEKLNTHFDSPASSETNFIDPNRK